MTGVARGQEEEEESTDDEDDVAGARAHAEAEAAGLPAWVHGDAAAGDSLALFEQLEREVQQVRGDPPSGLVSVSEGCGCMATAGDSLALFELQLEGAGFSNWLWGAGRNTAGAAWGGGGSGGAETWWQCGALAATVRRQRRQHIKRYRYGDGRAGRMTVWQLSDVDGRPQCR